MQSSHVEARGPWGTACPRNAVLRHGRHVIDDGDWERQPARMSGSLLERAQVIDEVQAASVKAVCWRGCT